MDHLYPTDTGCHPKAGLLSEAVHDWNRAAKDQAVLVSLQELEYMLCELQFFASTDTLLVTKICRLSRKIMSIDQVGLDK